MTYQYLVNKRKCVLYAITVIAVICFACENKKDNSDLAAEAINSITEIFKSHPIVALGESHGWKEESEFIFSLIKNEEFQRTVNDIVVECGNAKYQFLMDDYVMNGKQIPQVELQKAWRNMTVLCTCDAPIYEELFKTVKEVNVGLQGKKLRVLLGEPGLDWTSIHTGEDLNPWIIQRDVHYAGVVEREVLSKRRKALLIMGSFHFIKAGWGVDHTGAKMFTGRGPSDKNDSSIGLTSLPPPGNSSLKDSMIMIENPKQSKKFTKQMTAETAEPDLYAKNVFQLLEQEYPNQTFVILPHDGYGEESGISKIEEQIKDQKPKLLLTKDTWIGNTAATVLFSHDALYIENGKTTRVSFHPYPNSKITDLCDAYLFITTREKMHRSIPSLSNYEKEYLSELNRRSKITRGEAFNLEMHRDTTTFLHPKLMR